MIKYQTTDGAIFSAETADELVFHLCQSSKFDAHLSEEQFMSAMAERLSIYYGRKINIENPKEFVKNLVEIGYLIEIK